MQREQQEQQKSLARQQQLAAAATAAGGTPSRSSSSDLKNVSPSKCGLMPMVYLFSEPAVLHTQPGNCHKASQATAMYVPCLQHLPDIAISISCSHDCPAARLRGGFQRKVSGSLTGPDVSSWEGLWSSLAAMSGKKMLPLLQVGWRG